MSIVKADHLTESTAGAGVTADVLLKLAAGINFGGVNLSHYEEGTFVSSLVLGAGSATLVATQETLQYTRIGRLLHVQGLIVVNTVTTPSGTVDIVLPFAASAGVQLSGYSSGDVWLNGFISSFTGTPVIRIGSGASILSLYEFAAGIITSPGAKLQAGANIAVSATYEL